MIQGEAGLKLWMFLICFALGFDSSEGKKCCVSRAYAVCWVTPNFWENALTDEKKIIIIKYKILINQLNFLNGNCDRFRKIPLSFVLFADKWTKCCGFERQGNYFDYR